MGDILGFGGEDDERSSDEIVQQIVSDELERDLTYPIKNTNGDEHQLRLSADKFKNAILFLLSNVVICAGEAKGEEIDDFVYASGRLNNLYCYRINVTGLVCKGGQPKFVITDNNNSSKGGYINVHFTDDRNLVVSVSYPGVAYKRPFSLVTLSYEEFCVLLPVDRITGKKKDSVEYYWSLMTHLMENFKSIGVNMTLMQRTSDF